MHGGLTHWATPKKYTKENGKEDGEGRKKTRTSPMGAAGSISQGVGTKGEEGEGKDICMYLCVMQNDHYIFHILKTSFVYVCSVIMIIIFIHHKSSKEKAVLPYHCAVVCP